MDFARITVACADSEPYEYGYEDPEHECYEFDLPIFADRLPTKISCKRPCGIIYKRHGERCKRQLFLKYFFGGQKSYSSRVADTPGLKEKDYRCVRTVDLDIDPETSCSSYEYDSVWFVSSMSCICEGELCNVPEYDNGKKALYKGGPQVLISLPVSQSRLVLLMN